MTIPKLRGRDARRIFRSLFSIAAALGFCLLGIQEEQCRAATIWVSSPDPVSVGQSVAVDVNLTLAPDESVSAYQMNVLFPSFLEATNVTELGFFVAQGSGFESGTIDNVGLDISSIGDSLSGDDLMVNSGPLFEIDFTAIAPGSGVVTIDPSSVFLIDGNFNELSFDTSPGTVTAAAAPEPSTALLLLAGVGFVAIFAKRGTICLVDSCRFRGGLR